MNRSKKIRRKKRGGGRSELGKGRERGKGGGDWGVRRVVKRLRKEETSVGERQDARSKEGGANREMGEGSKMEKGRKTEKEGEDGSLRREEEEGEGFGKGGMKREG